MHRCRPFVICRWGPKMLDDVNETNSLARVAQVPASGLVSEEDVKNKVVLPLLKALGYSDYDFSYEGRTGRGYVDISVEHYPSSIVVETKAPRTRLENYRAQLEAYVFHKHREGRITLGILTDGHKFHIYGVTGPLFKDSLASHHILSFSLSELASASMNDKLRPLLSKQSNQDGLIHDVIAGYAKNRERVKSLDDELHSLRIERDRIDGRIREIDIERKALTGLSFEPSELIDPRPKAYVSSSTEYTRMASPHILRLLSDRGAVSKDRGVHRNWLDDQLINKVEGVNNNQAVSFGIIELRRVGKIAHNGGDGSGRPISEVWLLER